MTAPLYRHHVRRLSWNEARPVFDPYRPLMNRSIVVTRQKFDVATPGVYCSEATYASLLRIMVTRPTAVRGTCDIDHLRLSLFIYIIKHLKAAQQTGIRMHTAIERNEI